MTGRRTNGTDDRTILATELNGAGLVINDGANGFQGALADQAGHLVVLYHREPYPHGEPTICSASRTAPEMHKSNHVTHTD